MYKESYLKGMRLHESHPENRNFSKRLKAFTEEICEFIRSKNRKEAMDELGDVIHSFGILIGCRWISMLSRRNVIKHGRRFEEYGCIRSRRNCCGRCIG